MCVDREVKGNFELKSQRGGRFFTCKETRISSDCGAVHTIFSTPRMNYGNSLSTWERSLFINQWGELMEIFIFHHESISIVYIW